MESCIILGRITAIITSTSQYFIFISLSHLCFNYILILGSRWPDLCLLRERGFFVSGTTDSGFLDKNDHFLPSKMICPTLSLVSVTWAYEIWLKGSKDENFLIQLLHVCCLLPLFVSWSANPDNCFVPSGFYHCVEPIRLGDSGPLLESTCSCSLISTLYATWAPSWISHVILSQSSFFMGTGTWGKQGNPVVRALV